MAGMDEIIDQHFQQSGYRITCAHAAPNSEGLTFELDGADFQPCDDCLNRIRQKICLGIMSVGINMTVQGDKRFAAAFKEASERIGATQ